jgi:cyclase
MTPITRRAALGRVTAATLGVAAALRHASAPAAAQIPTTTPPPADPRFPQVPAWKNELRELAPGVFAYMQAGGPGLIAQGVSNAGVIVGDDHAMIIDATGAPLHAKNFIAEARKAAGDRPFRRLISTHHHGDHVNGNQFFSPIEIFSHPYCRDEVRKAVANTPAMWDKREGFAEGTEQRRLVPPTTTIEGKMVVHYGDSPVEIIHPGPAHTYGDLMIYLPKYRLLFASDLAFIYVAPFAHNAHVGKWLETVDRIMKMDVETIIPGHGPICGKKELAEMAEYFRTLQREVRKRFDGGLSPGRAAADIKLGKFDNWIGPERIVMNTVRLYNEFRGVGGPDYDIPTTQKATAEYNSILASRGIKG